ncbi:MAG: glycosyltransferase family 4 protein [Chloroflexota bacterium]|nr:glycosyltransferase family 4 protein [Chloroflexota bacterium]
MPTSHHKSQPKSIALVANQNEIFYRLRMPWVRILKENEFKVFAIVPNGSWNDRIQASGAKHIDWKLNRSNRNPFSEISAILSLTKILRQLKPDVVQNFHTKPNIYAPIAAKLAGVQLTVSTVTGLGYTFVERQGLGAKLGKILNLSMYSLSNRIADEVTFQNPDDMRLLRKHYGLPNSKGRLIPGGSGVDVTEYHPNTRNSPQSIERRRSLGIPKDAFVAMFVGRLQLDKGLIEFVEAARIIKQKRKDIVFVVVGAPDPGNKRSVTNSMLNQWKSEENVIFTGRSEDVPYLMAMSNTITTPTFYREGIPRTLLEAAATSLPLIGTDMPGVREVIRHGENGLLIPTHDPKALAQAVETLANDPMKSKAYGATSLNRAINEFNHRKVIAEYISLYQELWDRT